MSTLLTLPLHVWSLATAYHPSTEKDPEPTSPLPSKPLLPLLNTNQHHSIRTEPEQLETIQKIENAIAEAKFRRWGEEQGWSRCRMESERREFRAKLDRES